MTTVSSSTSTSSSSSTSNAFSDLSNNFETFLKLLTTQMQNQDPLQPMDTNEFTQQLVQYSQVEQQLATNDKLDKMLALQQGQGVQTALGYLGWEVSAETKDLPLQNSQGIFNVTLDSTAQTVNIGIANSTGKIVRGISMSGSDFSYDGSLSQDVVWDGKDNNGNQLADGTYSVVVTATDASGSTVKSTVMTRGTVTGIDLDSDGNTILKIGDMSLDPSNVTSIRAPSVAQTSTSTDTSSTDTSSTDTSTTDSTS